MVKFWIYFEPTGFCDRPNVRGEGKGRENDDSNGLNSWKDGAITEKRGILLVEQVVGRNHKGLVLDMLRFDIQLEVSDRQLDRLA